MCRSNRFFRNAVLGLSLFIAACAGSNKKAASNPEDQKLTEIIQKYSDSAKRLDPYDAPYFNVEADLPKFGDFLSLEWRERNKKLVEMTTEDLKHVDASKLSSAQKVAYELFSFDLSKSRDELRFRMDYFYFNQMGSRLRSFIDDASPDLTSFPFDSSAHYKAFLERSKGFPPFVDRQIENLKEGAKAGYALNCVIAKASLETYKDALEPVVEKNPFYRPVLKMPKEISEPDRQAITQGYRDLVETRVLPSFKKFDAFMRGEYMKTCRKSYGLKTVPNGPEIYKDAVRGGTDLDTDPQTIHQMGLSEVARIRKELTAAFKAIGYQGSLKSSFKKLLADNDSYFTNQTDMLAAYGVFRAKVAAEIPKGFSVQPKSDIKLVANENPEDAAGKYNSPTEFLPYGRFIYNGLNLKATPKWDMDTLFLHEAIPGHHFQQALAFEMKDQLSEYQRKLFNSNAFVEGWALYAERWGREVGLVSAPRDLIGSLSDEMLRAVRLVVDTGIHYYDWPREKVLAYMGENLNSNPREIQIEADRYSVWPGQALGYKVGQLKILELRERAKKELGDRFDIKEFHRVVIGGGTVSLPVLESNVDAWIASLKKAS